ncbi:hypothetical protein ACWDSJ_34320 [Nocardia sp. NPDC003482]
MSIARGFAAFGAVAAAAIAIGSAATGTAGASPVVGQKFGDCAWSADVISLAGVPMDGYANTWYIKTGRNDNTEKPCSFNVSVQFKLKGSGAIKTANFGSTRPAQDMLFDEGPARPISVSLQVCQEGVGCSAWASQHSTWPDDH